MNPENINIQQLLTTILNYKPEDNISFLIFLLILFITAFICLSFLINSTTKFIGALYNFSNFLKDNGISTVFSKSKQQNIRKRKQFCAVLKADLSYISKYESWNDQFFTDLEAEVESEGGYYMTPFHKLIRKKSVGLRKEKSLIKAIQSSTERAIQLTGEAGAGKSVALRHLATQLAEIGMKSNDKNAVVPLYINLREMSPTKNANICADSIRDFIFGNIRRGDSDTVTFVKQNWDDYRDRGVWYFLFDSFDEIPEILHAQNGSATQKKYAEAIREFLNGMGECKGVLASREFKGPEALPWEKFRIANLTIKKQHELVKNAFLSEDGEKMVLHHLASKGGMLAHTPLFLTLLCKYVKEEKKPPRNDHELLERHINRLAKKDSEYLAEKYHLTPCQLLAGAQIITCLFAEDETLGLSPTIEQIEAAAKNNHFNINVKCITSALVDTKIGRSDVQNASHGEQRFAFAHRRYQEVLFVRHIVNNPNHIPADSLLTDTKWREYTVTLLETQPNSILGSLFNAAMEIISNGINNDEPNVYTIKNNSSTGYNWNTRTIDVLSILQEGLSRRTNDIPENLKTCIYNFISQRWANGDVFDRNNSLKYASLLPEDKLIELIEYAFHSGTTKAEDIAFNQVTALKEVKNDIIRNAVLKKLSSTLINAKSNIDILRAEALSERLPHNLGSSIVVKRCLFLRKISELSKFTYPITLPIYIAHKIELFIKNKKSYAPQSSRIINQFALKEEQMLPLVSGFLFSISLLVTALLRIFDKNNPANALNIILSPKTDFIKEVSQSSHLTKLSIICFLLMAIAYVAFITMNTFRSIGEPLGTKYLLGRILQKKTIRRIFIFFVTTALLLLAFIFLAYFSGVITAHLLEIAFDVKTNTPPFIIGSFLLGAASALFGIATITIEKLNDEKTIKTLFKSVRNDSVDLITTILQSRSQHDLAHILKILTYLNKADGNPDLSLNTTSIRFLSYHILHHNKTTKTMIFNFQEFDNSKAKECQCLLEKHQEIEIK